LKKWTNKILKYGSSICTKEISGASCD
jgi:hypothetical protein